MYCSSLQGQGYVDRDGNMHDDQLKGLKTLVLKENLLACFI